MEASVDYPRIHKLEDALGLPGGALSALYGQASRVVALDPRETLYGPDRPSGSVGVVLSGCFVRQRQLRAGRRHVSGFTVPGDLVGVHAMFGTAPADSLKALEPSEVLVVSATAFKQAMRKRPEGYEPLARVLHERHKTCETWCRAYAFGTSRQRVATFVEMMRAQLGSSGTEDRCTIRSPIRQKDIADAVGLTVVSVCRAFSRLEEDGAAAYRRDHIVILSRERLARWLPV